MGMKGQAAVSTLFAVVTRGLGFVLRILQGRLLGAEAMGMLEMASGVQQLLLTPVVSGLPAAVSRLTAMEKGENRGQTLHAAEKMALRRGAAMMVLGIVSAPFAGLVLGDMRVVPLLLIFAPALPIVSVCCVMDGCAYGLGKAFSPAVSECAEQLVRIAVSVLLLTFFADLYLPIRAAVPTFAGLLGEGAGLMVMAAALRGVGRRDGDERHIQRQLDRLALPMMGSRAGMSILRSVTGMLLPRLLVMYGLSSRDAAAQIGLLQGMVMPLLFLPGIVTGAFASLGGPQMAARKGRAQKHLAAKLILLSLFAGMAGAVLLYLFAPLIGDVLYGQSGVAPLLRKMSAGALFISLNHILSAMLMGLGRQKALFARQMVSGAATLMLTVFFTVHRGIAGTGMAILLGQAMQCMLLTAEMRRSLTGRRVREAKYSPRKA